MATKSIKWQFQLIWLEETFIKYINEWKNMCNLMVQFPEDVRNRFHLNHQTTEGLRITGILNLSSNTGYIIICAKETVQI